MEVNLNQSVKFINLISSSETAALGLRGWLGLVVSQVA
jgi:hypothetical protein